VTDVAADHPLTPSEETGLQVLTLYLEVPDLPPLEYMGLEPSLSLYFSSVKGGYFM